MADATTSPPMPTPAAFRAMADELTPIIDDLAHFGSDFAKWNVVLSSMRLALNLWADHPIPARLKATKGLRGGTDAIITKLNTESSE